MRQTGPVIDQGHLWERIRRHAGEAFTTKTGMSFSYRVPGNHVRVSRNGAEINRSLSRTNSMKAAALMPVDGPGAIGERQGSPYTWAILMDERIRASDW